MNLSISTVLGIIFLLAGAICVYTMLEIRGRPKPSLNPKILIKIHKISGYLFVLLYIFMIIIMVIRLSGYRVELSPRANIHIVLAITLLPLLAIKLLIVRLYKKLSAQLLFFGTSLFVVGFIFTTLTGGDYILPTASDHYSPNRNLTQEKCARCHTLERTYATIRTQDGWTALVNKMRNFDSQWISEGDVPKIVDYLALIRGTAEETPEISMEVDKSLFERKCGKCHSLQIPLSKSKTKEAWQTTIRRMQGYDAKWLTDEDIRRISDYLSEVRRIK